MPTLVLAQASRLGADTTLRMNTKQLFPKPPVLYWSGNFRGDDTLAKTQQFQLGVCISNLLGGDSLRVRINGRVVERVRWTASAAAKPSEQPRRSGGLRMVAEENPCGTNGFYPVNIQLQEGSNQIQVEADNATGKASKSLNVKFFRPEKRLALVIGNEKYDGKYALKNPLNDARDVRDKLRTMNFDVMPIPNDGNLTREQMLLEIYKFAGLLSNSNTYKAGLFYYAGHGVQLDGENYLVPIDAVGPAAALTDSSLHNDPYALKSWLKIRSIRVQEIFDLINNTPVAAKIFVLDACQNNPFTTTGVPNSGIGTGLAKVEMPSGSMVCFATAAGAKADDGMGNNGTYTKYLLKNMQKPNQRLLQVIEDTELDVQREGKQRPYHHAPSGIDFYFLRDKNFQTP